MIWTSDVAGAVRTAYLISLEWLSNDLPMASRYIWQGFQVRGHNFWPLGACLVLNHFSAFYPGTAPAKLSISSTPLFKVHLALERLDAELISPQYINTKQYAR